MRPRAAPPPALVLERRGVGDEEIFVAHHVVRTADASHVDFVDSFKSRAVLDLPPREWTQEGTNPELAEGISAYLTTEAAAETARQVLERGRSIGEFVAEMWLCGHQGIEIAIWGRRGHLTIWGDALILSQTTVDIVQVA